MTQPATQPAPAAARDDAAVVAPVPDTVDVPTLLNRLQLLAIVACVLFGIVAAGLQVMSWQANRAAAADTEQLVRVQDIQSTLFRADALATNAFLIGGLEPPAQRKAYDAAIDGVSRAIADAAEAQPADRKALAALNTTVTRYATSVEQARSNNRQGFPVGAEYLQVAGSQLRADAVPILGALVDANAQRSGDEMLGQHPLLLLLTGALALLVLVWVNRGIARRFRRRFNLGIVGAGIAIGLLTVVAVFVSAGQSSDNGALRSGSYRTAVSEATARTAANDAKANESLRLIKRGSGQAFEDAWTTASATVTARTTAGDAWQRYVSIHRRIVTLDNGGRWDDAVRLATTSRASGSTAALEAFDTRSRQTVAQAGRATTDRLRSGNTGILLLAVLSLLVGLAAAGAAAWGVGQRRKEYA